MILRPCRFQRRMAVFCCAFCAAKKPSSHLLCSGTKAKTSAVPPGLTYAKHTPAHFRMPTSTRSPDNGRSPRLATEPAAVRHALGSPFTRTPPAAIPPPAALCEALIPDYSSSSLVY